MAYLDVSTAAQPGSRWVCVERQTGRPPYGGRPVVVTERAGVSGSACGQVSDCRTAERRGHERRVKRGKRAIDRVVPTVGEVRHHEDRARVPAADIACGVLDAPGRHSGAVDGV